MKIIKYILVALLLLASPVHAWMSVGIVGGGEGVDMTPDAQVTLSLLAVPSVSVDMSVIAETPVAPDTVALNVTMPSISASTVVKYSTTYNGNGNDGGSVPTDSNWYASGATVTVLGNTGSLTKTGYTWTCWNTQADGGGTDYDAAETFELTAGTILYAKWTAE